MTCTETFFAYILRAIGLGEHLPPRTDFTLCQEFVLIGSGDVFGVIFCHSYRSGAGKHPLVCVDTGAGFHIRPAWLAAVYSVFHRL